MEIVEYIEEQLTKANIEEAPSEYFEKNGIKYQNLLSYLPLSLNSLPYNITDKDIILRGLIDSYIKDYTYWYDVIIEPRISGMYIGICGVRKICMI